MQVVKESAVNPEKSYKWTPESKFEITGVEFGIILNSLRAILSTQEAKKILLAERAHSAIESVLSKAIESGVAFESNEN